MAAKKIILKLSIDDESDKKRALKGVAGVQGVDSVTVDMKEKKMTVIGEVDPVCLTSKLRKFGFAELLSVGPAKEEKKEGEKKEEKKEGEKKGQGEAKKENKAEPPKVVYIPMTYTYDYRPLYECTVAREEYTVVRDEYPNACAIC